jgi:hypothetical protein
MGRVIVMLAKGQAKRIKKKDKAFDRMPYLKGTED